MRLVGPSAPATNAGLPLACANSSATLARELRARVVELRHQRFHAVVGLRDRGGVERVRLDDVGAGLEIRAMDTRDEVRAA